MSSHAVAQLFRDPRLRRRTKLATMANIDPPESERGGRRTRAQLLALLAIGTTGGAQAQACDANATPAVVAADAPTPVSVDDGMRVAADRHAGKFGFAGGETERDAVLAAIDDVVAEMNPFARGIARERLREANRVPELIEIARNEDLVAIQFDDRRYEAPLDGSPVEVVGVTGDALTYRLSVKHERVRQSFVGEKGGRENTLALHGEHGLALSVRVTSDSLPKPLAYRLTYRRKDR